MPSRRPPSVLQVPICSWASPACPDKLLVLYFNRSCVVPVLLLPVLEGLVMLVRYPLGEQRSGRLGATIASHNRYGSYYRAGTVPVNPNTARQVAVRAAVQTLSLAWANDLSEAQRDAWDLYGANVLWFNKLGQPVNLKGLPHYVRSNAPRLQGGVDRIDDAPVSFTLAQQETAMDVSASEATQQLSYGFDDTAPWCDADGAAQFVYIGRPQNASRTFFGGPYRLLTVILGDSVSPPSTPITALATPDWPFAEDQKLWCRSRICEADGRLSQFAQQDFLAGS